MILRSSAVIRDHLFIWFLIRNMDVYSQSRTESKICVSCLCPLEEERVLMPFVHITPPPPALYCPAAEAPHSLKSQIICRTCCQQFSAEALSSSKEKQLWDLSTVVCGLSTITVSGKTQENLTNKTTTILVCRCHERWNISHHFYRICSLMCERGNGGFNFSYWPDAAVLKSPCVLGRKCTRFKTSVIWHTLIISQVLRWITAGNGS